jgi:hypothetical protein
MGKHRPMNVKIECEIYAEIEKFSHLRISVI